MELSLDAKCVLRIIDDLENRNIPPSLQAIRTQGEWAMRGKDDQALSNGLEQLVGCELASFTGLAYSLTRQRAAQVKLCRSEDFDAWLVAYEQSVANRTLCKRVYGLDLCQANMMGQLQLSKLLEVMNLGKRDHVLDLGCGIGLISEHISDVTGAKMMGIDFAAEAIRRARERTHEKRDRLSFRVLDMDDLDLPDKRFSAVISIDTLYFVKDLVKTIQASKACLQENGQMGIFYTTKIEAGQNHDRLKAEQTPLAEALNECGLNFQSWDFTQDERAVWEKSLQVAEELKQDFEAEGNSSLYEGTVTEAKSNLEFFRTARIRRYLYHVQ